MLYRKIIKDLKKFYEDKNAKIILIDGARQVGKTYIIRETAKLFYKNYIEINLANDFNGDGLFKKVRTITDFYIKVSLFSKSNFVNNETLIFLDEIQYYPHLFTLLKPLKEDNKFKIICSGSELGIAIKNTNLIPMGAIDKIRMYPMDFEEFLLANNVNENVISILKDNYLKELTLSSEIHNFILKLFKTYLIVGGLPECVKTYVESKDIITIRRIQTNIKDFYSDDASKYDIDNKLKIKLIYNMLPSIFESKIKRIQMKKIEEKKNSRFSSFIEEFEYLMSSGIAIKNIAISEPRFPLIQSSNKNLIKLYFNDVGILSNELYQNNVDAILDNDKGINLGALYETVVAQELCAHNHKLYYYDRRKVGEVDFLIDDYLNLSPLPIEIKSGKDYTNYKALPKLLKVEEYKIKRGIVLSNNKDIYRKNNILHLPIYFIMFL